eukprot:Platyproteum_vivax@DN12469_c0_g1_i1.p1
MKTPPSFNGLFSKYIRSLKKRDLGDDQLRGILHFNASFCVFKNLQVTLWKFRLKFGALKRVEAVAEIARQSGRVVEVILRNQTRSIIQGHTKVKCWWILTQLVLIDNLCINIMHKYNTRGVF